MAEETDSSSSPELPIHVVHPNPTIWKPCSFRYFCSPLPKREKMKIRNIFLLNYTEG